MRRERSFTHTRPATKGSPQSPKAGNPLRGLVAGLLRQIQRKNKCGLPGCTTGLGPVSCSDLLGGVSSINVRQSLIDEISEHRAVRLSIPIPPFPISGLMEIVIQNIRDSGSSF